MTDKQRHILEHSLGLDYKKRPFRNHFCAGPGHEDWEDLLALEEQGLMVRGVRASWIPDTMFHVTPAGKAALGLREAANA